MEKVKNLIKILPKAELHLHIEGTLEAPMLLDLAQKNGVKLPFKNLHEIQSAYDFEDLQSFLDLYYLGAKVLQKKEDFYALSQAYIAKARRQNIVHVELFFDPQTHLSHGVKIEDALGGIYEAFSEAQNLHGMTFKIIACFLRDLSAQAAMQTYEALRSFFGMIAGFGLDSAERGNPPSKFAAVFAKAKAEGFRLVAHAGEEAGADYIREAVEILGVQRIDHGVRILEDFTLCEEVARRDLGLTVCPNSNICLKVFPSFATHPLKKMFELGLQVCVNSDDPAYFKGYLNENLLNMASALNLDENHILELVKNSFKASFLSSHEKQKWLKKLEKMEF